MENPTRSLRPPVQGVAVPPEGFSRGQAQQRLRPFNKYGRWRSYGRGVLKIVMGAGYGLALDLVQPVRQQLLNEVRERIRVLRGQPATDFSFK